MTGPTRFVCATPVLAWLDIERSVAFYCSRLGFAKVHVQQGTCGIVSRGAVQLHFGACAERQIAENTSCRVRVEGIDALYAQCTAFAIVHPNAALDTRPWGTREFGVLDPRRQPRDLRRMERSLTPPPLGEPMQALAAGELVLEPLVTGHAEAMFAVLGDPALYRYLDHPPPPTVEHLREVYAGVEKRLSPDASQVWLNWVVRRPAEAPLGYVQATVMPNHTAWVGYVFSAQHGGRGHATQAVRAMLEHLAGDHGVRRFLASVEAENLRSIRLLERLGFREAQGSEPGGHELSPSERLFVR